MPALRWDPMRYAICSRALLLAWGLLATPALAAAATGDPGAAPPASSSTSAAAVAPGTPAPVVNANCAGPEQAPTVREGQVFHAAIPIVNPYDKAVRVRLLDASCSCATLTLQDHFLLPKARTTLLMDVETSNRSGPQDLHVSLYVTDPDLEPIEVSAWWRVQAMIQVDSLPPGTPATQRPDDRAWQDIYRYVVQERPDEPMRLHKRIRLSCPAGEVPAGGLQITGIDYAGTLWQFTPKAQADGSWLILATARPGVDVLPVGAFHETATVHTNHPGKPSIVLHFDSTIAKEAPPTPGP